MAEEGHPPPPFAEGQATFTLKHTGNDLEARAQPVAPSARPGLSVPSREPGQEGEAAGLPHPSGELRPTRTPGPRDADHGVVPPRPRPPTPGAVTSHHQRDLLTLGWPLPLATFRVFLGLGLVPFCVCSGPLVPLHMW